MIPVAMAALLSFSCTGFLLCYLLTNYGLAKTLKRHCTPQYHGVVLIFQLLLGDFIQALGFGINANWLTTRKLHLGHICDLQGTLIQTGDLLGALFVSTIALHTFSCVIAHRQISEGLFWSWIAGVWFIAMMTGIGAPALSSTFGIKGEHYWTLAGAWCWIRADHKVERLFFHYVFIFAGQIICIAAYTAIYIRISRNYRHRFVDLGPASNPGKVEKAARIMVLYPMAYLVCTLPLAVTRMISMLGGSPSLFATSFAGTIFTSSGLVNSVLYGITRNLQRLPEDAASGRNSHLELEPLHSIGFKVTATVRSEPGSIRAHLDTLPAHREHSNCSSNFTRSGAVSPFPSLVVVQRETIMKTENMETAAMANASGEHGKDMEDKRKRGGEPNLPIWTQHTETDSVDTGASLRKLILGTE